MSKLFEVYVPCIYSEVHVIEANSPQEAIKKIRDGQGRCIGESITGLEDEGFRAVEIIHKKGPQRKRITT